MNSKQSDKPAADEIPSLITELERRREMAKMLDCFTEEDFWTLAGVTYGTMEAWRKRGTGPSYVRLGTKYYYPISSLKEHIKFLTRVSNHGGDAL